MEERIWESQMQGVRCEHHVAAAVCTSRHSMQSEALCQVGVGGERVGGDTNLRDVRRDFLMAVQRQRPTTDLARSTPCIPVCWTASAICFSKGCNF